MNKLNVANKVTRAFGKTKLAVIKHSPEILVGVGVVGVVASTVLACKATIKAHDIMQKAKKDVECVHTCLEHADQIEPEAYTQEDVKKDLRIIYTHTGIDLVKTYAPSVVLGAVSLTCILASNNILRKRNVALAAAYKTVDTSFKNYRKRVVDRFGEELDKELRYDIKAKEVEEKVVDENGKEKTVKKTIKVSNPNNYSDYARCFTVGNKGWENDAEYNLWYLKRQEEEANRLLQSEGYLFLNDVYEMLGIPRTKAGNIVGWRYNPKDKSIDSYVSFGIYDINKEGCKDFVNGYEQSVWLDFNVDGPILDYIGE